jgi:hypothetical protein
MPAPVAWIGGLVGRFLLALGVVCHLLASDALAGPITYSGSLTNGNLVSGTTYQAANNSANPVGAVYYSFYADAGASVTISGSRVTGAFDMAFWVYSGMYSDTDDFGSWFPSTFDDPPFAAFIAMGDDERGPAVPGPFKDPEVTFVAPSTGNYTVAVTNFRSLGDPPYEFTLQASGVSSPPAPPPPLDVPLPEPEPEPSPPDSGAAPPVHSPEPGSLAVFALAAAALAYRRRGQRGG